MTTETLAVEPAVSDLSQSCCPEDTEPRLVVHIPRDAVSILGVSFDVNMYLETPVDNTAQLRSRLASLSSLPQGEMLYVTGKVL